MCTALHTNAQVVRVDYDHVEWTHEYPSRWEKLKTGDGSARLVGSKTTHRSKELAARKLVGSVDTVEAAATLVDQSAVAGRYGNAAVAIAHEGHYDVYTTDRLPYGARNQSVTPRPNVAIFLSKGNAGNSFQITKILADGI